MGIGGIVKEIKLSRVRRGLRHWERRVGSCFEYRHYHEPWQLRTETERRGWCNRTAGKASAWHIAGTGWTPSIPYGPLGMSKGDPQKQSQE